MITNLLFKAPIPKSIPERMQEIVDRLKRCKTKSQCVKMAYDTLTKRYHGHKMNTYLRFHELFETDLDKIWQKEGFMHCTTLNFMMRILLIKSGLFKEEDLKQKLTFLYLFSPHQYLKIRLAKDRWVSIDVWDKTYGTPYGKAARFFNV